MEGESAAWEMLEMREEESAALEKRLKTSEAKRLSLLKSMAGLKKESDQWGELCDLLQVLPHDLFYCACSAKHLWHRLLSDLLERKSLVIFSMDQASL